MSIGSLTQYNPGPAQHDNLSRARALERSRAGIGGRTAGIDIVDEEHGLPLELCACLRRHRKSAANNPVALAGIGSAQESRRPTSRKRIKVERQAARHRQVSGNERGLVEAPPEYSPAMRRHRDQHPRLFGKPVQQEPGDELCQSDASAMFQLERNVPRDLAINDRGISPVVIGRLFEAGCANRKMRRDRGAASFAPLAGQELQRLPACRAKLKVGAHNLPASGASRRKRKGYDTPNQRKHMTSCCFALVDAQGPSMMPPEIFSRTARRQMRDRMLRYSSEDRWIVARMAEDLLERLDAVRAPFGRALLLGGDLAGLSASLASRGISTVAADPGLAIASASSGVACDEDRLPFADGSFDLVIAIGTLDTVSDLPGALVLIRRILTAGGLFLGALPGAGSLPFLKSCLQRPESGEPAVARFHPQIDVRGAGDLLARAGFSLPVAENELVQARYRTIARLASDLRANGLTNCLAERRPLARSSLAAIASHFTEPVVEQFSILTLTGWVEAPR